MTTGEDGFSMIELMISLAIGMVVLALVLVSLTTFLQTGYNGVATGQAADNMALVMTVIRRQVINADVLYNPATEGTNAGATIPAGFSLRMLTAGARTTASPHTTLATATVPTCVQWRLLKTGSLQDRSWPTGRTTAARPWHTAATGIVNTRPGTPPFVLDTTGAYQHRVVKLSFSLPETTKSSGTALVVKSSVTALDAQFFNPTAGQYCGSVPSP